MARFIFREGFILGVHTYLWWDSYIGRNSYMEFRGTYGGIHIEEGIYTRSSHAFTAAFICSEEFI